MPSQAIIDTFVDKGRFAAQLTRSAVPHPRTILVESPRHEVRVETEHPARTSRRQGFAKAERDRALALLPFGIGGR